MATLTLPRWRNGPRDLPDVCMNCGFSEEVDRRTVGYLWSDWRWIFLVGIPIIGWILMATYPVFRYQRLWQPLCPRCHRRYVRIAWLGPIIGLTYLIAMAITLSAAYPLIGRAWTIIAGVMLYFAYVIPVGLTTGRSYIRPRLIDDDTITLVRVHSRFIEAAEADAQRWWDYDEYGDPIVYEVEDDSD